MQDTETFQAVQDKQETQERSTQGNDEGVEQRLHEAESIYWQRKRAIARQLEVDV